MTGGGGRRLARSVVVDAPPAAVFELLADPRRHAELDGSGSVQTVRQAPERLAPGASFTMGMRLFGLPYWVTSHVSEFEEARRIAWHHAVGHTWRWLLAPRDEGRTEVTEEFDWSTARGPMPRVLELVRFPALNARGIEGTLERLRQRLA